MKTAPHMRTERVKAARATLDDTALLLRLHRLVESLHPHAPPQAHIVQERQPLVTLKRVGLFAGSFNPLTGAHLALADAARHVAALDAVIWSIAAVTVDKECVERASVPDRLAQLHAYSYTTPADVVASINRGLYVEEAEALRVRLADSATLFILVGFDKIVQIFDPHYYADRDAALRDLFALAHILVGPREDLGADQLEALLARPENRAFAPFVQFVPVAPEHARDSSTEARTLAMRSPLPMRELEQLVPPEGLALIQTGAYAATEPDSHTDPYLLREQWLNALDLAHVAETVRFPPLSRLVMRSARATGIGARLRTWLDHPTKTSIPADVRRIIAPQPHPCM